MREGRQRPGGGRDEELVGVARQNQWWLWALASSSTAAVIQHLQHGKALRSVYGGWWHNVVALVGDCRPPEGLEGVVPDDGLIAALEEIARKPTSVPTAEANAGAWVAMAATDASLDKDVARE